MMIRAEKEGTPILAISGFPGKGPHDAAILFYYHNADGLQVFGIYFVLLYLE